MVLYFFNIIYCQSHHCVHFQIAAVFLAEKYLAINPVVGGHGMARILHNAQKGSLDFFISETEGVCVDLSPRFIPRSYLRSFICSACVYLPVVIAETVGAS